MAPESGFVCWRRLVQCASGAAPASQRIAGRWVYRVSGLVHCKIGSSQHATIGSNVSEEPPREPLPAPVAILLIIYGVILAPWIPYFTLMGSGMAFEGGHTRSAYCFVTVVWAYPFVYPC